jgi:ABC-type nitrate/sulfonate/bicarbonate transport system substrate-binding protein
MRPIFLLAACVACCGLVAPAVGQGASKEAVPKVIVGDNPSLSGAPLYLALEKGYYRAAGIDVQLEMSGTTSDMGLPFNSRASGFV